MVFWVCLLFLCWEAAFSFCFSFTALTAASRRENTLTDSLSASSQTASLPESDQCAVTSQRKDRVFIFKDIWGLNQDLRWRDSSSVSFGDIHVRLVGWLICWLDDGWLVDGWLVDWLAGLLNDGWLVD